MQSRLISLAVLALVSLPLAAPADTLLRSLTMSGAGHVELEPDMAVIQIGVEQEAETAAAAFNALSVSLMAVMERLAASGIADRDLQTSGLRLEQRYEQIDSDQMPKPVGYTAASTLTVRVRDIVAVGAILDAVVQDGANRLYGLSFDVQEPQAALDQARAEAVADARAKAVLYAEAAGVTLGPILSISEPGYGGPQPVMMEMAFDRAGSMPVAGGEISIGADVVIVWQIGD
jgi:uncharacterized protein YggE